MAPSAPDEEVFEWAVRDQRVIVAADADFGAILAARNTAKPSVLLFRTTRRAPGHLLDLIRSNLSAVEQDLDRGAVVVVQEGRMRVRRLPILGGADDGGSP